MKFRRRNRGKLAGVRRIETEVFVHVKDVHLVPRDLVILTQGGQKGQLRVRRGEDEIGNASDHRRAPEHLRSLFRRGRAQIRITRKNAHPEFVHTGFENGVHSDSSPFRIRSALPEPQGTPAPLCCKMDGRGKAYSPGVRSPPRTRRRQHSDWSTMRRPSSADR